METWKKALVAIAIVAIFGGLWATEFITVKTTVGFEVKTKYGAIQIAARDPIPCTSTGSIGSIDYDSNWIVANETNTYYLILGKWATFHTFTASAAFLIANTQSHMIKITHIKVYDTEDASDYVWDAPFKIYLHANPNAEATADSVLSGVLYYDGSGTEPTVSNPVYLAAGSGYTTDANGHTWLNLVDSEGTAYALWIQDIPGSSGEYIYIATDNLTSDTHYPGGVTNFVADGLATSSSSAASFCWVQIAVDLTGLDDPSSITKYRIEIWTESV